jgi:hypothetical protein
MPATDSAANTFGATRPLGDYRVAKWRGEDFGQFEEWIRDRREKQARTVLMRGVAERLVSGETVARILVDLRVQPIGIGEMLDEGRTREGMNFALWLSLRQQQPELALADVPSLEGGDYKPWQLLQWIVGLDALPMPTGDADLEDPDDPPAGTGLSASQDS